MCGCKWDQGDVCCQLDSLEVPEPKVFVVCKKKSTGVLVVNFGLVGSGTKVSLSAKFQCICTPLASTCCTK